MPFAQDGTITLETIISRYNADLANTLGNLVNRTVAMINKYFGGSIINPQVSDDVDGELKAECAACKASVTDLMNKFRTADALESVIALARRSNKYIDETAPWVLAKDEASSDRLKTVLYNLIESIRFIGVLLSPFMPETSEKILCQINAKDKDYDSLTFTENNEISVGEATPLFARLDEAKKLEEVANDIFKPVEEVVEEEEEKVPEISIDDFAKIQLKVGKVLECKPVEGAKKLLVSQIKIGSEVRQIVSGIAEHYSPEDMVGKKVAVITNLKPVKLRGVLSEGMILAASDDKVLSLLSPDKDIEDGSIIR